ncbi:hypothetical protein NDA11_006318 [Ustilago hordei]|uniref:BHLH domain-containing protein n=1 Tax=Ustilago hordei TaxID=120017 RepID=I2FWG2_USTHO|nr:uncharacterized protein UHO2_00681 [Ustilago hordei]KAJ1042259.1 hypothetical protein NDA10_007029 [Ustilago hordei]KAJ1587646.1 hypothetical protein NDA15_007304 [Ustilago hordei]KAJ1589964.1 hypothetical protein NDA12_002544 [Ustilago hordei]KAJ1594301.1 hypothetical protein NDA11_006318 [Ustilago hordei]UTT96312.1 hypothetical protein NDA17_000492 [Ustilago hordei]
MATPSCSHLPASAAFGSSSANTFDKSSDLPPMPVPYEDFQFSLDLPAELDLNDLQFLSSVDRKGGPSNPMTPRLTSHFMGSTPQAMPFGHDDIHMSSRSNSRRGSVSKGSRPASPRVGSSRFSESALRPPPPPDFEPSGPSLFDMDTSANSTMSPFGIGTPGAGDKGAQGGQLFDAKEKNLLVNFLQGFEWDFDPSLPEGMPSFSAAAAERSAAEAEAMGFPADFGSSAANRDPMLHEGPAMSAAARRMQNRTKVAAGLPSTSSGSGSGSATASSQSPHDTSSSATSPHGSVRSHQHRRSLSNNKSRSFHHDADLVNTAFGGGLSEWSTGGASHQQQAAQQGYANHAAHDSPATGSKRNAGHFGMGEADEQTQAALALGSLTGMHADMFRMSAGLDIIHDRNEQQNQQPPPPQQQQHAPAPQSARLPAAPKQTASGKKLKTEHEDDDAQGDGSAASKRELLTESEKRQNHILSEQRRRNYIREGFKDLVVLLDDGRNFGARALGLSSGFGTGVEDEGLDDRSDIDDAVDVLAVGRKKPPKKAKKVGPDGVRQRGKGRGRGGSAGGGAGSKSAVLFQAVDFIRWLDGKSRELTRQCEDLEQMAGIPDPESIVAANRPASAKTA